MTKNAIAWIREDFRIDHNPALSYATQNHENVIALIGICNNIKAKKFLNINESSNILVIGCEGNADVKLYKQLLSKGRK